MMVGGVREERVVREQQPLREEQAIREEVVNLARALIHEGLVVRTWGNFSARVSEHAMVITPSGKAYETMEPGDLVKVSLQDGSVLSESSAPPSSEAPMHVLAYQIRKETRFVLHTHQVFASALSLSPREFPLRDEDEAAFGSRSLPIAPYALPGTAKLHRQVGHTLRDNPSQAVLMARHGAFILGETAESAFERARKLERFTRGQYDKLLQRQSALRPHLHYDEDAEVRLAAKYADGGACCVSADEELLRLPKGVLHPYLDDFAQICGIRAGGGRAFTNVRFAANQAYAVCYGKDEEDARNIRAVLEKNVRAAHVARAYGQKPIALWEAALMRWVYQNQYSKKA